jgi:hypothetical protein
LATADTGDVLTWSMISSLHASVEQLKETSKLTAVVLNISRAG